MNDHLPSPPRPLHGYWAAIGIAFLAAWIIPTFFPVYFRNDDVAYLLWAKTHTVWDCFHPNTATLFGMFRPLQNLTWWSLYQVSGLNPFPYQVALTFCYLLSLIFYFGFIRTALSSLAAKAALVAYAIGFHFLTYIIFWYSDFTYVLELMFMTASLWLTAQALRNGSRTVLTGGFALFVAAILSKEPAALIIPPVVCQLVANRWRELDKAGQRRWMIVIAAQLILGAAWLLLNPAVRGRQGLSLTSLAALHEFILPRWRFYAGVLISGPAIIIWAAALFIPAMHLLTHRTTATRAFITAVGMALAGAFILRLVPSFALIILAVSCLLLVIWRHPAALGALWALPALIGLTTVEYVVRTYLVECSFGLALICGAVVHDLTAEARHSLPLRLLRAASQRPVIVVFITLGCLVMAIPYATKFRALQTLCGNRQSFGQAVAYLTSQPSSTVSPLVIIDYADRGLQYERDILPMNDLDKAVRQKTMTSDSLSAFLAAIGSIEVHNFSWLLARPSQNAATILTMNDDEVTFLRGRFPDANPVAEWTNRGMTCRLYRLQRPTSASR